MQFQIRKEYMYMESFIITQILYNMTTPGNHVFHLHTHNCLFAHTDNLKFGANTEITQITWSETISPINILLVFISLLHRMLQCKFMFTSKMDCIVVHVVLNKNKIRKTVSSVNKIWQLLPPLSFYANIGVTIRWWQKRNETLQSSSHLC